MAARHGDASGPVFPCRCGGIEFLARRAEVRRISAHSLASNQVAGSRTRGDLFRREGKNTHLSELGRMVRPHLEMVFYASATAKRVSQDLTEMKSVPLKLGIMSTIAPDEIVDLVTALKTQ